MRRQRFTEAVLLVTLISQPFVAVAGPGHAGVSDMRKPIPRLALTDKTGRSVGLAKYRGQVVLLDFWATWCEVCKTTIPRYVALQAKYRDDGLSVVGVSLDTDGWASINQAAAQFKINYPILLGSWTEVQKAFRANGLPVAVLIDRSGRIAYVRIGAGDEGAFELELQRVLREKYHGTS
jgi:peroxiredoxin